MSEFVENIRKAFSTYLDNTCLTAKLLDLHSIAMLILTAIAFAYLVVIRFNPLYTGLVVAACCFIAACLLFGIRLRVQPIGENHIKATKTFPIVIELVLALEIVVVVMAALMDTSMYHHFRSFSQTDHGQN